MRPILLSLLFAASMLHAAVSSMTVSMESKGVPKAEFRSGTNAVYTACKSERRSSTNAIYSSLQNCPFQFLAMTRTPSGEDTITCLPGYDAAVASPVTFTTTLNCVLLSGGSEDVIIEAIPSDPSVKLSVSTPFDSGGSSVREFSITSSGHSGSSYVNFVVRLTYQCQAQLFPKSPDYPHARVLLYKFRVMFPPE